MQFGLWLEAIEKTAGRNITSLRTNERRLFQYNIYKNPTKPELLNALRTAAEMDIHYQDLNDPTVKGFLTDKGDIYIWPEMAGYHEPMAGKLGVSISVTFYVTPEDLDRKPSKGWVSPKKATLNKSANYCRMMGLPDPEGIQQFTKHTGLTWKDALKYKKIWPGGLEKLPYTGPQSEGLVT